MFDLSDILTGASLALSIARYIGLIENKLEIKLDLLIHSELRSGLRTLEQAGNSESEQECKPLLREARVRFNKAATMEKECIHLAVTYVGLALCHYRLGDVNNAKSAIEELISIPKPNLTDWSQIAKYASAVAAMLPPYLVVPFAVAAAKLYVSADDFNQKQIEELAKLDRLQAEAKKLLKQL